MYTHTHKPSFFKQSLNIKHFKSFVGSVKLKNTACFTASQPLLKHYFHLECSETYFMPKVEATQLIKFS